MNLELLLGDEALALGAIDAGLSGAYAYPGTPSTEITEFIENYEKSFNKGIKVRWCVNEKTAYEIALGMSYAGKRSLVSMKHVGLNVAADAFINSAITGANGGLIIAVADDPSMHSSQNEQDSRFYAKFAMIPAIEPSNQQEAYDAAKYAFSLSEQIGFPVMIRLVTLLAHSRSNIKRSSPDNPNPLHLPANISSFILLPSNARNQYQLLIEKQAKLAAISEQSPYNIQLGSGDELGIIAFGIAFNYAMEVKTRLNTDVDILKISQYPIPIKKYNNSSKLINKYS